MFFENLKNKEKKITVTVAFFVFENNKVLLGTFMSVTFFLRWLSAEIGNVKMFQFSFRCVLEESRTILSLAFLYPMSVNSEGTSIDHLQKKNVRDVVKQFTILFFYRKVWKLINWDFAINNGIGSMEFFLLAESCHFYFMFIYYKNRCLHSTN